VDEPDVELQWSEEERQVEAEEGEGGMGCWRKLNHCSEVFWHPTKIVCREGDHARENKSPASVSRYGSRTQIGVREAVDQICIL